MKEIYSEYDKEVLNELRLWEKKIFKETPFSSQLAKAFQDRFNGLIPKKVHKIVTAAIKNMVKAVLTGSKFITKDPLKDCSLEEREERIKRKIGFYKKSVMLSGAGTGAGGFFLGMADFPILLSLKMKFLFDIASIYGYNVKDFKERLFILYIFQFAFSSKEKSIEIYKIIKNWNTFSKQLPPSVKEFDWHSFQQEYRDYIDLPKMLQLIPGFGAIVGAYANYQFMEKLAITAINAYRIRLLMS